MKLMKNGLASVVMVAVGVGAIGLSAEPLHAQHVHAHVEKAKNFTEAVSKINEAMARLDAAVKSANMDAIATEADTVAQYARQTRELVMAADSGVAREQIRNVNQTGRNLAGIADQLHTAADKGNINNCRTLHEEVKASHDLFIAASPVNAAVQPAVDVPKYIVELSSKSTFEAGHEVSLAFSIRNEAGEPVYQLTTAHGRMLHAIVVSEDLSWFVHGHPEAMSDGGFVLRTLLPHGGFYTVFSGFKPMGRQPVVTSSDIDVAGALKLAENLVQDMDTPKTVEGYTVAMETDGPITAGRVVRLKFSIEQEGRMVEDLEPFMGSPGHLVAISADRVHFIHAHPDKSHGGHHAHDDHDHDHAHDDDHDHGKGHDTKMMFAVTFPAPGMYRSWLEFQHNGNVVAASFTFEVTAEAGGNHDHDDHHDHDHGHDHKH